MSFAGTFRIALIALPLLFFQAAGAQAPESDDILGDLHRLMQEGRYAEAVERAREFLPGVENKYGPDALETADLIGILVGALWNAGEIGDEVLELADRQLRIKQQHLEPTDPEVADAFLNVANVYWMRGDYSGAEKTYRQVLEIRGGLEDESTATARNNLALAQLVMGDYTASKQNFEQALALREKLLGPESPVLATTLLNLAILLQWEGNYAVAETHLFRGLALVEKEYGPKHPRVAAIQGQAGSLLAEQRRYAEAVPYFESALKTQVEVLGADHMDVSHTLNDLGYTVWYLGRYAEAEQDFRRSLEIVEGALGPEHPGIVQALLNCGFVLQDAGKFAEAGPFYRRALKIVRQTHGDEHFHTVAALQHLSENELEQGHLETALDLALDGERINRTVFQRIAASLTETEALSFDTRNGSTLRVAFGALGALGDEQSGAAARAVFDELIRSRAMVLGEIAARRRILVDNPDAEVAARRQALNAARDVLAQLIVQGPGDDPAGYLEAARQAHDRQRDAELALAEKSREFRRRQRQRRVGYVEVAAALPADTALVAFSSYSTLTVAEASSAQPFWSHDYVVFVLAGKDEMPRMIELGPAAPIDEAILAWRRQAAARPPTVPLAARQAEARVRQAGERLRELLWDPIAEWIPGTGQVIVVPDATVHLVSFAALPADARRYLAESGPTFHYLSAERDLVRGKVDPGRGLLAMGGADFDGAPEKTATRSGGTRVADDPCSAVDDLKFASIPASRDEAAGIVELWKQGGGPARDRAILLTGERATEAAFRESAEGFRVLHLATHGFFVENPCSGVPVEDAPFDRYERAREAEAREVLADPLLLAGLALSGANSRRTHSATEAADDGIVTAAEIAALDLSGVEWVVLSACETGLGKVQTGEGVLGLRRAFETAGAETLIMSLWQVDDVATRAWMEALYRARMAGKSTPDALRAAMVEAIESRRNAKQATHPFYWGAFVAAGDWR